MVGGGSRQSLCLNPTTIMVVLLLGCDNFDAGVYFPQFEFVQDIFPGNNQYSPEHHKDTLIWVCLKKKNNIHIVRGKVKSMIQSVWKYLLSMACPRIF